MSVPIIPSSDRPPRREIRDSLDRAWAHYEQSWVKTVIDDQILLTLNWLRSREGSYDHMGGLHENVPWWPAVSFTEDPIILVTRLTALPSSAFEHGLLHFMKGLERRKALLFPLGRTHIAELVRPALPSLIREAVVWHHGIKPSTCVSLKKLAELLNFSPNTKITKARPRLDRLCDLGLLNGRHRGEYSVSLGPVGDAFYTKVFVPIVSEVNVNPLN